MTFLGEFIERFNETLDFFIVIYGIFFMNIYEYCGFFYSFTKSDL